METGIELMPTWGRAVIIIVVLWAIGWTWAVHAIRHAPTAEELWPDNPELW